MVISLRLTQIKEKLAIFLASFKSLSKTRKISVTTLLLLLLALPVGVFAVLGPVKFFQRAYFPATPPITPPTGASNRVFVTSTTYNGNLGGLAGADAKCQVRANAANLGGIWKAWLSSGSVSASSRLYHSSDRYVRLDGVVIANSWADLTDGNLQNYINVTEFKTPYNSDVWTNTKMDGGVKYSTNNFSCANWTSSSIYDKSTKGMSWQQDINWTDTGINGALSCNNLIRLYCFEQTNMTPTPTSYPTPTVVPSPTPTVIPTPTPTVMPTPTSSPGTSKKPEILTQYLLTAYAPNDPESTFGQTYMTPINVRDVDSEQMSIQVWGLPWNTSDAGLIFSCVKNRSFTILRTFVCQIKGQVKYSHIGTYNLTVEARDGQGGVGSKNFTLVVKAQ